MKTLVLFLAGPLQSWGGRSTFSERDTQPYPTWSALIGMLASARGIRRSDPLPEGWTDLSLLVRIDRPGRLMDDFHTIGGDYPPRQRMRTASGKRKAHPVLTRRWYLMDAAFTVFVSGADWVVDDLEEHLRSPRWSPYLGRRSCPPAFPVLAGTTAAEAKHAARTLPLYREPPREDDDEVRVKTAEDAPDPLDADHWPNDVPVSRDPYDRRFSARPVLEDELSFEAADCKGGGVSAYREICEGVKRI
ncbi:type I-E CRISPR-associated protein Cas5/CasD [Nocardiopsis sp. NPDC049922]|uniref:type I-E CRISPR-associated protein Cas5/CasD n=1 Tax=Nocardiopsis sp. NPDC049922 TaxID=3155157 RepID=UPI0033EC0752